MREGERVVNHCVEGTCLGGYALHNGEGYGRRGCRIAALVLHEARGVGYRIGLAVLQVHIVEAYRPRVPCGSQRADLCAVDQRGFPCAILDTLVVTESGFARCADARLVVCGQGRGQHGSRLVSLYDSLAQHIQVAEAGLRVVAVSHTVCCPLVEGVVGVEDLAADAHEAHIDGRLSHAGCGQVECHIGHHIRRSGPCRTIDVGVGGAVGGVLRFPVLARGVLRCHLRLYAGGGEAYGAELILPGYLGGVVTILIQSVDTCQHDLYAVAHHGGAVRPLQGSAVAQAHNLRRSIALLIPC